MYLRVARRVCYTSVSERFQPVLFSLSILCFLSNHFFVPYVVIAHEHVTPSACLPDLLF